jgi:hypothetical protein
MRYSGGAELLMALLALVDHRKVPKHPFASSLHKQEQATVAGPTAL